MRKKLVATLLLSLLATACGQSDPEPEVTIAINPWPGYEFLHLAEQKGFFKEIGLNVRLVHLESLSDVKRAYVNGNADGLASTIVEAVHANLEAIKPLKIVMVPDYSNGGDVIIARDDIKQLSDLKGKTVGCEVTSLGIYLLQRALHKHGMSLDDVNIVNMEQTQGEEALQNKSIDAFVTYPPVSVKLANTPGYGMLFSSADIPREIVDTVSLSEEALNKHPGLVPKLHTAWKMALEYYTANQNEAVNIMATRQGIKPEEFSVALADLHLLNYEEQQTIFSKPEDLDNRAVEVCKTLKHVGVTNAECDDMTRITYDIRK